MIFDRIKVMIQKMRILTKIEESNRRIEQLLLRRLQRKKISDLTVEEYSVLKRMDILP